MLLLHPLRTLEQEETEYILYKCSYCITHNIAGKRVNGLRKKMFLIRPYTDGVLLIFENIKGKKLLRGRFYYVDNFRPS